MSTKEAEFIALFHSKVDEFAQGDAQKLLAFLHTFYTLGQPLFIASESSEDAREFLADRGYFLLSRMAKIPDAKS